VPVERGPRSVTTPSQASSSEEGSRHKIEREVVNGKLLPHPPPQGRTGILTTEALNARRSILE